MTETEASLKDKVDTLQRQIGLLRVAIGLCCEKLEDLQGDDYFCEKGIMSQIRRVLNQVEELNYLLK